ncbi:MAG: hypothetical protein FJ100_19890 [Deltaproteobacteria bacterium]|nr:hypothetical protein [Deltaproteobacteria bacterium]
MARALGGTAYDHRQPLLRNLPFVPVWQPSAVTVQAMVGALRAAGLAAFAIGRAALDVGPTVFEVRSFALSREGLSVHGRSESRRVAWTDIGLALPCRADSGQRATITTTTKKQSLARMAMGVPVAGKTVETETERSLDHSFFCLLWARRSEPDGAELLVRLECEGLDYAGLGAHMTGSSTANYLALLRIIQAQVGAAWDPRLERAGGKVAPVAAPSVSSRQVAGKTTTETVAISWDTAGAIIQAARLLVIAQRLRGLG